MDPCNKNTEHRPRPPPLCPLLRSTLHRESRGKPSQYMVYYFTDGEKRTAFFCVVEVAGIPGSHTSLTRCVDVANLEEGDSPKGDF